MNDLKKYLKHLYNSKQLDYLTYEISKLINGKNREKSSEWYKSANIYVTYPNAFKKGNSNGLRELSKRIKYLKEIGMTAIHILPPFESPMIDAGFDISNYFKIRTDLGGNKEFTHLINECQKEDLKIFVDFVLNHISYKHDWFLKAQKGEKHYRDFFIYQKEKPLQIKKYESEKGPFAQYNYNGKIVDVRVIFPEFVGELSHWTEGSDGYWYYHSFYPQQIDVNWLNPNVFLEFSKILIYWAEMGLSFRFDAAIFIGKDVYTGDVESPSASHNIIKALNSIIHLCNNESIILSEVVQDLATMKRFYGTEKEIEVELNYNFFSMTRLWETLLLGNSAELQNSISDTCLNIPKHAGWVNFLRNHDGLTFEHDQKKTVQKMKNILSKKGISFMAGLNIAGRTFSFLDRKNNRAILAHLLLASLPGAVAIYYGDEIGKGNDIKNMHEITKSKMLNNPGKRIFDDFRDINRGILFEKDFKTVKSKYLLTKIGKIFNIRKIYSNFFRTVPIPTSRNKKIYSMKYCFEKKNLYTIVNISQKPQKTNHQQGKVILKIGKVLDSKTTLTLQPNSGIWIVN